MAFKTTLEPAIVDLSLAVGLGRDHVDDLASACDQIGERPHLRIGYCSGLWPDAFSEQGNHFGIEPIGLGEPTYGACEGPDLARIDDCEPQPDASQRRCDSDLETAGGLEDDEFRGQTDEPRCEVFQTICVVRQAERLPARPQMDVQMILGTSMPTKTSDDDGDACMTLACECGLAMRPKRLFGFTDATVGRAPHSSTGSRTQP